MSAPEFSVNVQYGSSSRTDYYSQGTWRGKPVWVHELLWDEDGPSDGAHDLGWMTYFGEPEPSLWCPHCCGVAADEHIEATYWAEFGERYFLQRGQDR